MIAGPDEECHGELMAAVPPTVRRMRAIACLAVAAAVPLTAGTILWVVATVMRRSAPHGRGGTASAGEVLVLAGLVCGLALIIAATLWQRRMHGTSRPVHVGRSVIVVQTELRDDSSVLVGHVTQAQAVLPGR